MLPRERYWVGIYLKYSKMRQFIEKLLALELEQIR